VSHSHIEAWIKRIADQPLAAGTINTRSNDVRSVFFCARRSLTGSLRATQPRLCDWNSAGYQTLKRNSTTSPSAIT
jgi:hypothetical protein